MRIPVPTQTFLPNFHGFQLAAYSAASLVSVNASRAAAVDWVQIRKRAFIRVDGVYHSLAHLAGMIVELVIEATPRHPQVSLQIHVEFTSHCVSFGPKHGQQLDFGVLGMDRKILDHRRVARAFCPRRYQWSLQLPRIVRSLANSVCYYTGSASKNWLVVELIDDAGHQLSYEIYFQLRRDRVNALRMVIESAYVRMPGTTGPTIPHHRKGKVRFKVLAAKISRGDSVRDPRPSGGWETQS